MPTHSPKLASVTGPIWINGIINFLAGEALRRPSHYCRAKLRFAVYLKDSAIQRGLVALTNPAEVLPESLPCGLDERKIQAMNYQRICKVTVWIFSQTIVSVLAVVAIAGFAAVPCAHAQTAKDTAARAQAAELFAKALTVSDIRAPGSPPFELRGTINIQATQKTNVTGTYLLKWVSPTKWREEIGFHNYTRVRVGGDNEYSQTRTTPYEVAPIFQLERGLDFLRALHVWSNPAAIAALKEVKLHHERAKGTDLDCVALIPGEKYLVLDYCFDPVTGTEISSQPGPDEYSGFISFDGKYFPRSIRAEDLFDLPVTFIVNSLSPLTKIDVEDFQAPQDSTIWQSCENPDRFPIAKHTIYPKYPMAERSLQLDGTVVLYGLIGVEGRLSNLKVLSTPDEALANSVLTAVKQWKYDPETCNGIPVPTETVLHIGFALPPDRRYVPLS